MQFIDLAAQQKRIKGKLDARIQAVLAHGNYIMGPEIKELEEALGRYTGTRHAISCASGTDALLLALMAYGVGPGDAILTTPFTFIATAEVISLLGATPVFVDIDPETFNLDPAKLNLAIKALQSRDPSVYPLPLPGGIPHSGHLKEDSTGSSVSNFEFRISDLNPRGIIAVDLFGLPADYDRINAIAKEHGLFVIEDAAQSFGAEYKGRKACALADVGCTSFFPAKPLGCYGDGGMCFTDDDKLAEVMKSIRVHGKGSHKYENVRIGINGRLDTMQAAILLPKFEIFPEEIDLRQKVAETYTRLLTLCPMLHAPCVPEGYRSVWAQYSLLAKSEPHRSELQEKLKAAGIPTAIYYPKPLHLQSAYSYLGYKKGGFPISEDYAQRIFSIPMHPYLAQEDQEKISRIIGPQITQMDADSNKKIPGLLT